MSENYYFLVPDGLSIPLAIPVESTRMTSEIERYRSQEGRTPISHYFPGTGEGRWKGCGDHVLHCWAHFVCEGDITTENLIEDKGMPLSEELVFTYIEGGFNTQEHIGHARTDCCLSYQLSPKPDDKD